MADDMGIGDVGCYNGDSKIPTPNMDRLALEGIRFTDAHSPSAVCTPTRYGVLTGRDCWRSRLKSHVLFGYEPPLIEPDRLTLASLLKDSGYHTACIGKWHLGLGYSCKSGEHLDFDAPLPWKDASRQDEEKIDFAAPLAGGPNDLGFDYFYGTSGCATAQPPYAFIENRHFPILPSVYNEEAAFTGRKGMTAPGWFHKDVDPAFTQKAVEYIESRANSEQPFFLYLPASAPHEPCLDEVVPEFARGKSQAGPRGDLVWLFDWMVGQVMETLERTGLAQNTIVVATSDNGALPGDATKEPDHGGELICYPGTNRGYRHYNHKSCGDWRGYKSHIWEGGHREPFIIRWPGVVKPGLISDELVCLNDFLATCAEIVGVPHPQTTAEDSFSICHLLAATGDSKALTRPFLVHHSVWGVFSLRLGQWKVIFDTKGSGGWPPPPDKAPVPNSPGQLYNITEDPFEQNDLWASRQDVVKELSGVLQQIKTNGSRAVATKML